MNERQARQEGLEFTGIYSWNKEEVKERIAKERKEKPKARIVLVRIPHNKLSRGGGDGGWSAYADAKYKAYDYIAQYSQRIEHHPTVVLNMLEKHDKERLGLEASLQQYTKIVEKAKEILEN